MSADVATASTDKPARRLPRALLWSALVGLLVVAQTLLVALTISYESSRAQERTDEAATQTAGEIRQRAQALLQGLQALHRRPGDSLEWRLEAATLLRSYREMARIRFRLMRLAEVHGAEKVLATFVAAQDKPVLTVR